MLVVSGFLRLRKHLDSRDAASLNRAYDWGGPCGIVLPEPQPGEIDVSGTMADENAFGIACTLMMFRFGLLSLAMR
jgi:hypothetical protein